MHAAFPPNSRTTFFLPAFALSAQPTSGDPVKESSLIRASVVNGPAASGPHGRMLNAAFGHAVSEMISPSITALIGVFEAGFNTHGQPTAMAGAILCAAR